MECRGLALTAALPGDTRGPENVRTNTDEESGLKDNNSLIMTLCNTYLTVETFRVKTLQVLNRVALNLILVMVLKSFS